nr:PREDICTED: terminal uridylyltransferase 7 isoform X1 [Lepisosteus oculatus]XP_015218631.1 PREDICTED: terminal uridylyltransferase 7 isoform X1 [Lepisosteus oculatus]XP_015218642.1 PREDICTED: terminal uridylyltransferase 7 isoform X1 [Lepisosteus oculatus]XP_015218650.1 PREDICTED: terminal uridylyltransferase 7 isoform X1 [Lepisosteus oculatus]
MEDSGRSSYSKHDRKGKAADDSDSWRSPLHADCLDYGRGLSSMPDKGAHKKRATPGSFGSSPRKGGQGLLSTSPAGFKKAGQNPGQRMNDELRDGFRNFPSQEDHRIRAENWRERHLGSDSGRRRKDSFQEASEDVSRQAEDVSRGHGNNRRHLQKKTATDESAGSVVQTLANKLKVKARRRNHMDRDEDRDVPVIDESALSEKELLGLIQAEERLKREDIFRLKKQSHSCPDSKYICMLCDVLIDSISSAHKHIKEKWHKKKAKEKQEDAMLTALPPPNPSQVKAIGSAIDKIVQEHGLSDDDITIRQQIVEYMQETIKSALPDCSLRLYGSSCTRFGFKDSDVNIDIQFPAHMHQPDVLLLVQESLKNSPSYIDLEAHFHTRVPVVVCREKQSGLLCKVSAGNDSACQTTALLAAVAKREPCLAPLAMAFRRWAKICHIDQPDEGGLPPYAFALMVIYFLQQRKEPVLPVYLGSWIEGFSLKNLVDFRLTGVEDGHVLWEYSPSPEESKTTSKEFIKKGMGLLTFDSKHRCEVAVGQLWVEMLRFYLLDFPMTDHVICIRVKQLLTRESKDWPKKRIAIEDPYSVKRNVARTLNSQLVYEYILHCLKTTYKYFASPLKRHIKPNKQNQKQIVDQGTVALLGEGKETMPPVVNEVHLIQSEWDTSVSRIMNVNLEICSPKETITVGFPGRANGNDGLTEQEAVYIERGSGAFQEDSDCIIEEIVMEEPDGYKPSSGDTESGNEEEEQRQEDEKLYSSDAEQLFGEEGNAVDSSTLPCFSRELEIETESHSDSEGRLVMGTVDSDDFGFDEAAKPGRENEDADSSEGLAESLGKMTVAQKNHDFGSNNSDEDNDEVCHRSHLDSLTTENELDNLYTASGEEALSDDEGGQSAHESAEVHSAPEKIVDDTGANRKSFLDDPPHQKVPEEPLESCTADQAQQDELSYEFSKLMFTKGKSPTVVCSLCKHEGHLKRDCPEDFKRVELDSLPPMTPKFLKILHQVCMQCYNDFSPDVIEEKVREHILQDLEKFVRMQFPGAKLSLFGSSKNGFGFKQSDLDICLTFEGKETAEGLDCIGIIESLAKYLKKHSGLRNILPITTAKVPIVKFFHLKTGLEGDISLYNTLALHNTRLLACYAAIDARVKYLCYTMKVFAKVCDIGDASRGSLSSYAYTLMVLYYLQQRNPPVIPVLQELYDGPKKPEVLVDGWNVYFFDDLENLSNRWPDFGKNTESVGELWLGLLQFYTEEFDFKEHVICIRRKKLLTTFKKQWTSKYIVIEDPFDLHHNLGAGLSRRMTNFIMKAFINGRRVFGSPVKVFPSEYSTKMEYFFDPEVMTEGELAPNDRCCRICGKIGHFMKDCPLRRKLRQKRDHRGHEDALYQKRHHGEIEAGNVDGSGQRPRADNHEAVREWTPRQSADKWRKQEEREFREKRCFICGAEGHIKKECSQYKGSAGNYRSDALCSSPSAPSNLKNLKAKQGTYQPEEKQKQKQPKIFLSPQAGRSFQGITVEDPPLGRSCLAGPIPSPPLPYQRADTPATEASSRCSLASKHMTQGRSAQKWNQLD